VVVSTASAFLNILEANAVKFIHHRQVFIVPVEPERLPRSQVAQAAHPLGGGAGWTNGVG